MSDILSITIAAVAGMLESAEGEIDAVFGAGYAEKHPTIVAGFVQACALVYLSDRALGGLRDIAGEGEMIRLAISDAAVPHD